MNKEMNEIKNIYLENEYFVPDDYELEGISYYSHLKRTVFSLFDKDLNIYMLFNKHTNILDKYYIFKEKEDNKEMYNLFFLDINDESKLNTIIKINNKKEGEEEENKEEEEEDDEVNENDYKNKIENLNPFIGITLVKYKFKGYNNDKEFVEGQFINTPYLLFLLGFYGGFKIVYAINESKKLEEKTEYFDRAKNISNKVLEILINEEKIALEKEKYMFENLKKEKNFIELNNLKKLNLRNLFLHEIDRQIKENLEYFENLAVPQRIKSELKNLQDIANEGKIKEIQISMDKLLKEAKDLFEKEDENQYFIQNNNELIQIFKNTIINLKNNIKIIQDNKNKSKDLILNINTPINELLLHPKIKNFFIKEEIANMIQIFDKIKNNYNLYENHVNLISELFLLNENLVKQIEECKNQYNSIKDKYQYLNNRKDVMEIKTQIQNNIFLMYMRVFEQFFFNLEQFENNNLNKEYLYLNQLKAKASAEKYYNDEEKEEYEDNISNSNNQKNARFMLKEEEDIDEGNDVNNSLSQNEIEEKILSSSSNKNNKNVKYNNINFNNNENQENSIISKNNNNSINKEENDIINQILGNNLVKEKQSPAKNYLVDILSNFEGRVTHYNSQTEENLCTDAEDLFSEYLKDEEKKENILKEKMVKKKKEKINIINILEEYINKQKEEKENIEKEFSLIDEKNKKEIIEKEKDILNLKKKFEVLIKKFEENKKEREKENDIFCVYPLPPAAPARFQALLSRALPRLNCRIFFRIRLSRACLSQRMTPPRLSDLSPYPARICRLYSARTALRLFPQVHPL